MRLPATGKARTLRLDRMLAGAALAGLPRASEALRNPPPETGGRLDEAVLASLRVGAIARRLVDLRLAITNADRAVGARIAGELASRQGAPVRLEVTYRGSAGQSFGAFCVAGMRLVLEGEANDYVGKGMSGGEIAIRPRRASLGGDAVLAGNTILYGATGGRLFVAGCAGERFAVRNRGALAVVEGVGDHACEYMTAGAVVVLGPTGRNLGAGMSGGLVYVFDREGTLARRYNPEMVVVEEGVPPAEEDWLREGVERHFRATGSARACQILEHWSALLPLFRRVVPRSAPAECRPAPWEAPARAALVVQPEPVARPRRWAWKPVFSMRL